MATNPENSDYLSDYLSKRLSSIEYKRKSYRTKTYIIFIVSTALSAIVTILLGLNSPDKELIRITALILTTIVTAVNAYNTFASNRDLWIANNAAKNRLLKIQFEIEFIRSERNALNDEEKERIKNEIQQVMDERNAQWHDKKAINVTNK